MKAFIASHGGRAKTDALDAAWLARYGQERAAGLVPWRACAPERQALADFFRHRQDLLALRVQARNRRSAPGADLLAELLEVRKHSGLMVPAPVQAAMVAALGALALMLGGAVQNLSSGVDATTVTGATQTITGGPVASQEAIKLLGTNGGGFQNANSAHPFANPSALTNWVQLFLILLIPFTLPRVLGRMVGQNRQGYAVVAVMALLALASVTLTNVFELTGGGTVPEAVGAALEGKETRFGVSNSATFAAVTTLTSTGAVNSFHDSYTALGGMLPMVNMMLGEVAPGGVGSGLYGLLILAVITVFVAGLMVGRTPEYLGKKIGSREITFAALYFLTTPALVLIGTAAAFATGNHATALNTGPHALSEVLYAFTSASNNNGSAFAGITVNTPWWDTALGLCMLLGRFLPIIFVLALAGSLARQTPTPASAGTLATHRPLFVGMVAGVTVVCVALTFLPALALGPLAEGL